jgi:hypothetical protein
MLVWPVLLGVVAAAVTAWVFARAPKTLRIPLAMFNGFYLLTSVIGAITITVPAFQPIWPLTSPGMDTHWLRPGDSTTYWLLVLGPFIVVNVVAARLQASFRCVAVGLARNLSIQPSVLAVALVGTAFIGYCFLNLANHGYLGVSLLGSENVGLYRENIQLRAEMGRTLGEIHFGFVYMAIPALCMLSFLRAHETGRPAWWLLFLCLTGGLTLLYMATLTKSNLIVFLVGLGATAYLIGKIRVRGTAIVALAGIMVLTVLDSLLTGTGLLEIAATLSNIIFRLSSAIPFYVEVYPEQQAFVGIDYGLQWFGIGPDSPANLVVFNYMYPDLTWVQGAAPAASHVVAYAQAGVWWSVVTMMLMGALIAFIGGLGRAAKSALARAAFIGGAVSCYYISQTDFVGTFNHAYGLKWWLLGVFAVLATELCLRWLALVPRPTTMAEMQALCESESR